MLRVEGTPVTAPAAGTFLDRRRPPVRRPRRSRRSGIGVLVLLCVSALGAVEYLRPAPEPAPAPFVNLAAAIAPALPSATATADAFGRSGEVKVRFSLPEQEVEFPLAISGSIDALHYQWVTVGDSVPVGAPRPKRCA